MKLKRLYAVFLTAMIFMVSCTAFLIGNKVFAQKGDTETDIVDSLIVSSMNIRHTEKFTISIKLSGQSIDSKRVKYIYPNKEIYIPVSGEAGTAARLISQSSNIENTEVIADGKGIRIKFLDGISNKSHITGNIDITMKGENPKKGSIHKLIIGGKYKINISNKIFEDKKKKAVNASFLRSSTNKEQELITIPVEVKCLGYSLHSTEVKLLANSMEKESVKLSEKNDWKHKFTNLPKYDEQGKKIDYTVKESIKGYDSQWYKGKISGDMEKGFLITYIELDDFFVKKLWNEIPSPEPQERSRSLFLSAGKNKKIFSSPVILRNQSKYNEVLPKSVTIHLLADDKIVCTGTLSKDNSWCFSFEKMPLYDEEDGHKVEYTIKEDPIKGYRMEYTKRNNDFYITNRSIIDIPVKKKWVSKKSDSVQIMLYREYKDENEDGDIITKTELVKTVRLSNKNGWKHIFKGLDKYYIYEDEIEINNEYVTKYEYKYYIKEAPIEGYDTTITGNSDEGFVVTNRYIKPEKVSVEGSKTWDDKGNQDGKRPNEITINLLKNGKKIETKKVTKIDGWKWKFENLDKWENGEEINYTITEEKVEGYQTEVKGFNLKNSYTPGKTSVQVTKAWKDKNNQDGKRPETVIIKLLADGKETGKTITLTKANNWTGSFTYLDEYKAGKKIEYTIKEKDIANGYTSTVTGNVKEGFIVTNVRIPKTPPVKPQKDLPKTGDKLSLSLYPNLIGLSVSIMVLLEILRRKKKRNGDCG